MSYGGAMNVRTIKEEIEHLSAAGRRELADWFAELEAQAWETEIEPDFSPGGAGMPFLEEMKADSRDGKFKPFKEGRPVRR
ncbi:conserved hypothetical protein [Candidatus Sulfopaludibacter sp. SbA4]|nr:conserved hypothetical protein [Candidatus Sulfopaludibacter sp. SbA4]